MSPLPLKKQTCYMTPVIIMGLTQAHNGNITVKCISTTQWASLLFNNTAVLHESWTEKQLKSFWDFKMQILQRPPNKRLFTAVNLRVSMNWVLLLTVQVLAPLQGGLPQQTGVIIQPQQIVLAGNKVQGGTQVSTYDFCYCCFRGGGL